MVPGQGRAPRALDAPSPAAVAQPQRMHVYDLLKGIRLVEGAAFIAAPLCGLTFVQLGADVIRFDPIGGGPDYRRWPLAADGSSYYWEGLNKGKRSIAIDLSRP